MNILATLLQSRARRRHFDVRHLDDHLLRDIGLERGSDVSAFVMAREFDRLQDRRR